MSDLKVQQLLEEWGLPGLINTFKSKSNPNSAFNQKYSFIIFHFYFGIKINMVESCKVIVKNLTRKCSENLAM